MTEEQSLHTAPQASPLPETACLSFPKRERLRHRNAVTRLFEEGKSEYAYPLRMFYLVLSSQQMQQMFHGHIPDDVDYLQMMITVPKKKFRRAVDRVWLRRRIREAYRLHRLPLRALMHADGERYLQLAFIYVGSEKRDYAAIEKKMLKLLDKASDYITGKEDAAGDKVAEDTQESGIQDAQATSDSAPDTPVCDE